MATHDIWSFHTASQVFFGSGAVGKLADIAGQWGYKKALLVTDTVLIDVGLADRVRQPLQDAGVTIEQFTGGEPEPSMNAVLACVEMARSCQPDVLIALGGGSNMDLAKAAAIVLSHGGHPRDYIGDGNVPGLVAPLICLPTTAGTGSEVSFATVLKDTEKGIKVGILSNYLRPRAAIVDPLLTMSCPAKVTADSGIDALTHAIEAYTAVDNCDFPLPPGETSAYQGRHPLGMCLAEKAIALVGQHLRTTVQDGTNQEAREGMALAALLAGMAFSNIGVAAVHALEYPVGSATGSSHGAGNGLLLPHVMRFNLPKRQTEFATIARLLGEDTTGLDNEAAAEKAIIAVEKLQTDIGIPKRLRDLGVQQEQLAEFAKTAFNIKRVLRVNPRPATIEDLHNILQAAF